MRAQKARKQQNFAAPGEMAREAARKSLRARKLAKARKLARARKMFDVIKRRQKKHLNKAIKNRKRRDRRLAKLVKSAKAKRARKHKKALKNFIRPKTGRVGAAGARTTRKAFRSAPMGSAANGWVRPRILQCPCIAKPVCGCR